MKNEKRKPDKHNKQTIVRHSYQYKIVENDNSDRVAAGIPPPAWEERGGWALISCKKIQF